jgi:hypothetical protein
MELRMMMLQIKKNENLGMCIGVLLFVCVCGCNEFDHGVG